MDLDLHGSVLAMVMLTLGFLVVLYVDMVVSIGNGVFKSVGPIGGVALVSLLLAGSVLVGVRLIE